MAHALITRRASAASATSCAATALLARRTRPLASSSFDRCGECPDHTGRARDQPTPQPGTERTAHGPASDEARAARARFVCPAQIDVDAVSLIDAHSVVVVVRRCGDRVEVQELLRRNAPAERRVQLHDGRGWRSGGSELWSGREQDTASLCDQSVPVPFVRRDHLGRRPRFDVVRAVRNEIDVALPHRLGPGDVTRRSGERRARGAGHGRAEIGRAARRPSRSAHPRGEQLTRAIGSHSRQREGAAITQASCGTDVASRLARPQRVQRIRPWRYGVALVAGVLAVLSGVEASAAERGRGSDGGSCTPAVARSCCRQCDWDMAQCRQAAGHRLLRCLARAVWVRPWAVDFDLRTDPLSSASACGAAAASAPADCAATAVACRRDCRVASDRETRCSAECGKRFACPPPVPSVPACCLRACRRSAAIGRLRPRTGPSSSIESVAARFGECSNACHLLAEERRSVTEIHAAARSICRDDWRVCVLRCAQVPRDDPRTGRTP